MLTCSMFTLMEHKILSSWIRYGFIFTSEEWKESKWVVIECNLTHSCWMNKCSSIAKRILRRPEMRKTSSPICTKHYIECTMPKIYLKWWFFFSISMPFFQLKWLLCHVWNFLIGIQLRWVNQAITKTQKECAKIVKTRSTRCE